MALTFLSLWRITFINNVVKEWNSYLDNYMFNMEFVNGCSPEYLKFLEKHKLKAKHYYLRWNVWEIEDLINDPFLLDDVLSQIKK